VFVLSQAEDPDSERSYSIVKRLFVAYVPARLGTEPSCFVGCNVVTHVSARPQLSAFRTLNPSDQARLAKWLGTRGITNG
jgi:hypothetical protein